MGKSTLCANHSTLNGSFLSANSFLNHSPLFPKINLLQSVDYNIYSSQGNGYLPRNCLSCQIKLDQWSHRNVQTSYWNGWLTRHKWHARISFNASFCWCRRTNSTGSFGIQLTLCSATDDAFLPIAPSACFHKDSPTTKLRNWFTIGVKTKRLSWGQYHQKRYSEDRQEE